MYMFVLVTLIVALIGIYTQVFNMQQSHIAAQQTGIAQAMLDWHATATGLAQNAVAAASVTATTTGGCSLTEGFNLAIAGAPPQCINSGGQNVYISPTLGTQPTTLTICSGSQIPPCRTTLPTSYGGLSNLKFYSVSYQAPNAAANPAYVLTFVPAPTLLTNGMPTFLCLPGKILTAGCGTQIDASLNDLMSQIKHRGTTMFGYGIVGTCSPTGSPTCPTGFQLVTPSVPSSSIPPVMGSLAYPVPAFVPVGAAGVISQINLCTNC